MNTLMHTQRGASAVAVVAAVAFAALAAFAGYWYGSRHGDAKDASAPAASTAPQSTAAASGALVDPKTGRKVLYWHDPMAPGQKFDKPGKSPFMDMDLVPVYADEASDSGAVSINPRLAQSFGVRTAVAQPGDLASTFSAVGAIASMLTIHSRRRDRSVAASTAGRRAMRQASATRASQSSANAAPQPRRSSAGTAPANTSSMTTAPSAWPASDVGLYENIAAARSRSSASASVATPAAGAALAPAFESSAASASTGRKISAACSAATAAAGRRPARA